MALHSTISILRLALLEGGSPLVHAKRFKAKINIQRPKPVHFERAVYLTLAKPWFVSYFKDKTPIDLCSKPTDKRVNDVDNPFQNIIAKEVRDRFYSSRLVAFYHANPMDGETSFKAYAAFKKENMFFRNYGRKTMEIAVKDTKFETILDFYYSRNMTVFSPEPDLKALLKISKRFRQLVLLAAIFEGKLINTDQIMELSAIPDLQTAQAGLVQTLNSAGVTLTNQLNSHQNTLVSNLEERIKQLKT